MNLRSFGHNETSDQEKKAALSLIWGVALRKLRIMLVDIKTKSVHEINE